MDISKLYQIYLTYPKISTDTRNILKNSLFFALRGDSFDGNSFAEEALNKGAAYAIVDDPKMAVHDRIILTDDVLQTLQNLATHHRNQFNIPFLAITGSNGKTTTKELVYATLSQGFSVYATRGNLNNHIGVPLTVLEIPPNTQIAIIEMGANHIHEIESLCKIAKPTQGLITNIGKAHLEGFGGFEGVKKAKGELYDYLKTNNGHIYIQKGNSILTEVLGDYSNLTSYGTQSCFDYSGTLVKNSTYLSFKWKSKDVETEYEIQTQLTGSYNLENVMAAIAIGGHFNLSPEQICTGIENYSPQNNRSQIVKSEKGNHLICDYYNANASSMLAAIENVAAIHYPQKVLILGDMFELGDDSAIEHASIIEHALSTNAQRVICIGKHFYGQKDNLINVNQRAVFFETLVEAIDHLNVKPIHDSWVLIKGSRGMTLEKLMPLL